MTRPGIVPKDGFPGIVRRTLTRPEIAGSFGAGAARSPVGSRRPSRVNDLNVASVSS